VSTVTTTEELSSKLAAFYELVVQERDVQAKLQALCEEKKAPGVGAEVHLEDAFRA
jgi:hypothetical protein